MAQRKEKQVEETYLTPKEAAHLMGVHYKTLYNWIRRKQIKFERRGPHLLFVPRSEVLRVQRGS